MSVCVCVCVCVLGGMLRESDGASTSVLVACALNDANSAVRVCVRVSE